jgi:phospholipid/cholesterol/gamma-HCH transport system substrate-binding protein
METNVNYTVVGAFVIFLTSVFVICLIWLSSGLSAKDYTYYKVYMNEVVSGLNIGAPVEFNGVNVGTVSRIRLNKDNPQIVELLLKIQSNTPITQGTRAKLDIRSLSGSSYMQLIDKGENTRPLLPVPGKHYAVIPTTPSILVRINTVLTQLSDSLKQIGDSIHKLLDPENLASIKDMLANMKNFTYTLSKNGTEIDAIIKNTSKATRMLSTDTLPSANRAFNVLRTETLPSAGRTFNNFDTLSQDLSNLSLELKQNPSMIIRGKATQPLGPGE